MNFKIIKNKTFTTINSQNLFSNILQFLKINSQFQIAQGTNFWGDKGLLYANPYVISTPFLIVKDVAGTKRFVQLPTPKIGEVYWVANLTTDITAIKLITSTEGGKIKGVPTGPLLSIVIPLNKGSSFICIDDVNDNWAALVP